MYRERLSSPPKDTQHMWENKAPQTLRSRKLAHAGSPRLTRCPLAPYLYGQPLSARPWARCWGWQWIRPGVRHQWIGARKESWGTGVAETGGLASSSKSLWGFTWLSPRSRFRLRVQQAELSRLRVPGPSPPVTRAKQSLAHTPRQGI